MRPNRWPGQVGRPVIEGQPLKCMCPPSALERAKLPLDHAVVGIMSCGRNTHGGVGVWGVPTPHYLPSPGESLNAATCTVGRQAHGEGGKAGQRDAPKPQPAVLEAGRGRGRPGSGGSGRRGAGSTAVGTAGAAWLRVALAAAAPAVSTQASGPRVPWTDSAEQSHPGNGVIWRLHQLQADENAKYLKISNFIQRAQASVLWQDPPVSKQPSLNAANGSRAWCPAGPRAVPANPPCRCFPLSEKFTNVTRPRLPDRDAAGPKAGGDLGRGFLIAALRPALHIHHGIGCLPRCLVSLLPPLGGTLGVSPT